MYARVLAHLPACLAAHTRSSLLCILLALTTPTNTGAVLSIEAVRGVSTITRASWTSPMRLLMPRNAAATSLVPPPLLSHTSTIDNAESSSLSDDHGGIAAGANWIYSLSYGGGLVNGDDVGVYGTVGDGCTAVLATQSSTKVYGPHRLPANQPKAEEVTEPTTQRLSATVGAGGLLAVLSDPVTLYADAVFENRQRFELTHETASLVLVDALTAGRVHTVRDAMSRDVLSGERWAFKSYTTTTDVLLPSHNSNAASPQPPQQLLRERMRLQESVSSSIYWVTHPASALGLSHPTQGQQPSSHLR